VTEPFKCVHCGRGEEDIFPTCRYIDRASGKNTCLDCMFKDPLSGVRLGVKIARKAREKSDD
jgi:hypothetical protein